MSCHRCHGLMSEESFLGTDGDGHWIWRTVGRCLLCGQIVDSGLQRDGLACMNQHGSEIEGAVLEELVIV